MQASTLNLSSPAKQEISLGTKISNTLAEYNNEYRNEIFYMASMLSVGGAYVSHWVGKRIGYLEDNSLVPEDLWEGLGLEYSDYVRASKVSSTVGIVGLLTVNLESLWMLYKVCGAFYEGDRQEILNLGFDLVKQAALHYGMRMIPWATPWHIYVPVLATITLAAECILDTEVYEEEKQLHLNYNIELPGLELSGSFELTLVNTMLSSVAELRASWDS